MRQRGLGGAFAILAVTVLVTAGCTGIRRVEIARTRGTIDDLRIALKNYERDMGGFDAKFDSGDQMPTGILKDASQRGKVVQILTGKTADGTVLLEIRRDSRWQGPYIEPRPKELKDGELVDAWGNPLMIRIKRDKRDQAMQHNPDSFEIYSFGPNGEDELGSGDDINNWDY